MEQLADPVEKEGGLKVLRIPSIGFGEEPLWFRDQHLEEVIVHGRANVFNLKRRRVRGIVGVVDDVQQMEDGITQRRGLREVIRRQKIKEAHGKLLVDLRSVYVVTEG